jgi:hypothetical protein
MYNVCICNLSISAKKGGEGEIPGLNLHENVLRFVDHSVLPAPHQLRFNATLFPELRTKLCALQVRLQVLLVKYPVFTCNIASRENLCTAESLEFSSLIKPSRSYF